MRRDNVIERRKPVHNEHFLCGAKSLAEVMGYYFILEILIYIIDEMVYEATES